MRIRRIRRRRRRGKCDHKAQETEKDRLLRNPVEQTQRLHRMNDVLAIHWAEAL